MPMPLKRPLPRSLALGRLLVLSVLALASQAYAQQPATASLQMQPPVERPTYGVFVGEPGIDPEVMTAEFLTSHPDLRWRREGMYAYNRKEYAIAVRELQLAARYGDKPAQALLAEMYWTGTGVAPDRPLAYAWMDIAAERNYPNFVIKREAYWGGLSQHERGQALARGMPLMDEYGDAAALKRLDRKLRQARDRITGSRLGFQSALKPDVPGLFKRNLTVPLGTGVHAGTAMTVSLEKYNDPKYWVLDRYVALKDKAWTEPPAPKVSVGQVQPLHGADNSDKHPADAPP